MSGTDLIVTFANQPGSITVRNYVSGALNISLIDAPEPATGQSWVTDDSDPDDPNDFIGSSAMYTGDLFVDGGAGRDAILGTVTDNYLIGGADQDAIQGSYGNDMLQGDGGDDMLAGGPGRDRFV